MATQTAFHIAATGQTNLNAYPMANLTFAAWTTDRVLLSEAAGAGLYTAALNDTKGLDWGVFAGATAPTDWTERVASLQLNPTPQDKVSAYLEADGEDLKLTIAASGETITAYSLSGIGLLHTSPFIQFSASGTGPSATVLNVTIENQAALAAEPVEVTVTVTTSQSGVLPQQTIRWRPFSVHHEFDGDFDAIADSFGDVLLRLPEDGRAASQEYAEELQAKLAEAFGETLPAKLASAFAGT
jgi:hypothetical protein